MMNSFTLPSVALALFAAQSLTAVAGPPTVRRDVLAAVEAELARLSTQARTEAGPVHPPRSSEIAFLLLRGLAAQGSPVNQSAPEYFRELGITPTNNQRLQLFTVADDAWVTISTVAIQDKSGYWTSKVATLYRRQGEKWVEQGKGSTALDGVALPD
jgi:hypothetical protein